MLYLVQFFSFNFRYLLLVTLLLLHAFFIFAVCIVLGSILHSYAAAFLVQCLYCNP